MIRIELARLSERERERWRLALEERPLLEARSQPWPTGLLLFVGLIAVCIYSGTLDVPRVADVLALRALCAGTVGAVAYGVYRAERMRRAGWPNGRFLYRWGYVEIEYASMRLVPGTELRTKVDRGPIGASGAGDIRVRLAAGTWSTQFSYRGSDADVPTEALDALATTHIPAAFDGYRDAPSRTIEGVRAGPAWPWPLPAAACVLCTAWIGAGLPHTLRERARERERAHEIELQRSEAEAALREPYRSLVLAHGGVTVDTERCSPDARSILGIDVYAHQQAHGRPVATPRSVYSDVAPYDMPLRLGGEPSLYLDVACSWTPHGLGRADPARARLEVRAHWSLSAEHTVLVERELVLSADETEAAVERCEGLADEAPYDALFFATLARIRRAIRIDVFVPARAHETDVDIRIPSEVARQCAERSTTQPEIVRVRDP